MEPSERIEAFLQMWINHMGPTDQTVAELALKVLQPLLRRVDRSLGDDPEKLKPYVRELIADLTSTFL